MISIVNSNETSVREKCFLIGNDGGLSSGSEVDNPVSDEDMEDIRQWILLDATVCVDFGGLSSGDT